MTDKTKKIIAREGLVIIFLMLVATFVFAEARPEFCPECKVKLKAVPIVYGNPMPEVIESMKRGEVVIGGCIVCEGQPNTALICPKCKKVFGRYLIDKNKLYP